MNFGCEMRRQISKNILRIVLISAFTFLFMLFPLFTDSTGIIHVNAAKASETDANEEGLFDDVVRVGLKYGSSAASSYVFESDSGFYAADVSSDDISEYLPITAYTSVVLEYEDGVVVLKGDDGNVLLADFASSMLLPLDYDDGGTIAVNGASYRDGMTVSINNSGTLNLINVLNIEHYVYGVLNSEMNHGHPIEALKAQAVAARSFAKLNLNRHSSYGFDLCTGTHCQVYKGYSDEYKETNLAVDETDGICMYYDGEPVSAYYFKNSGGYTQNIKDVWGSNLGYLKAVKDPYSPEYNWNVSYTFEKLENMLQNNGSDIGTLKSVEIVSRNESGAVDTLRFTGTEGSVSLSKEKIRTFFGNTIVKSTMFSFKDSGSNIYNDSETINLSVISAGDTTSSLSGNSLTVIGADGKLTTIDSRNVKISNGSTVVGAADYLNGSSESNESGDAKVCESVTSGILTFIGKGYGHGIGMPQDSAIEMAKQGFAFDEILQYYYTGVDLL